MLLHFTYNILASGAKEFRRNVLTASTSLFLISYLKVYHLLVSLDFSSTGLFAAVGLGGIIGPFWAMVQNWDITHGPIQAIVQNRDIGKSPPFVTFSLLLLYKLLLFPWGFFKVWIILISCWIFFRGPSDGYGCLWQVSKCQIVGR